VLNVSDIIDAADSQKVTLLSQKPDADKRLEVTNGIGGNILYDEIKVH
jgi:hypothetical protein